eukprot:6189087-Pleurochrysis_carterae.AAC.3
MCTVVLRPAGCAESISYRNKLAGSLLSKEDLQVGRADLKDLLVLKKGTLSAACRPWTVYSMVRLVLACRSGWDSSRRTSRLRRIHVSSNVRSVPSATMLPHINVELDFDQQLPQIASMRIKMVSLRQ